MQKISVIGAGSWGTTLAFLLGEKGFDVKLWARREELANDIESKKENRQYLPGIKIPSNVIAEYSLKNVIEGSEMIVSAVPSEFLRKMMNDTKPYFKNQIIVSNFIYIRQKGPYGNGTPVLNARAAIGDEPFAILWGDEFIASNPPRLKQMIDVWEQTGVPNISAVRVPESSVAKYGIADVSPVSDSVHKINRIVEKPRVGEAPGNLAAHGAYIMTPRLFEILEKTPVGQGGELWLTDAISVLAKEQDVHAVEIKNARYYDTGNKLEYLKTVVEYGLMHPEIKNEFAAFIKYINNR